MLDIFNMKWEFDRPRYDVYENIGSVCVVLTHSQPSIPHDITVKLLDVNDNTSTSANGM